MAETLAARRPVVLLLADAVREEWTRALEAGGLEVNATGWLDGVTAARIRRPDVILISTDLPEIAPSVVCNTFRTSELASVPLVVAGPGADRLDREAPTMIRADLYLPAPGDPETFAARVGAAASAGRLRWLKAPASRLVAVLVISSMIAIVVGMAVRLFLGGPGHEGLSLGVQWALFAAVVAPFAAALVVAATARTRPLSTAEIRTSLGWLGAMLLNTGQLAPGGALMRVVGASLALFVWAAWAWLGPRARARSPRVASAFRLLAGGLILLGLLPWAPLFWFGELS